LAQEEFGEPSPSTSPATDGSAGLIDPQSALARLLNSSSATAGHEHGE
jgi:hypothetical protein